MITSNSKISKIIIFDGICALCNSTVDLLIKLDKNKIFHYTPLQGEFVRSLETAPDIDSVIFYDEGTLYYKSTAILKILASLGGIWVLANIFYLIPISIRDFIYDLIAKYRYKVFGKREYCRTPKEDELKLFIK